MRVLGISLRRCTFATTQFAIEQGSIEHLTTISSNTAVQFMGYEQNRGQRTCQVNSVR